MTAEELESALGGALDSLSRKVKDTTDVLISENAPMSQIINSVYDNIYKCLDEFKEIIVDYETSKS